MLKFSIVSLIVAGIALTSARAQPTIEFQCGAIATQKRMTPGSQARRAFIQDCVAQKTGKGKQEPKSRPKVKQPEPPKKPKSPR